MAQSAVSIALHDGRARIARNMLTDQHSTMRAHAHDGYQTGQIAFTGAAIIAGCVCVRPLRNSADIAAPQDERALIRLYCRHAIAPQNVPARACAYLSRN